MARILSLLVAALALNGLLVPLASFAQAKPADMQDADRQDDEVVRVETNLVSLPVIVTTRGGEYVADMRKEEFSVFEDGTEQQVAFFATITQPFHVALLLDTSGSTEQKIGQIRQSAMAFVEQLQPADRVRVISFDDEIRVHNEFTNDQTEMRRAINSIKPGKGTRLYDAMQLTFNLLKPIKGRKAIVIFTDGVDYRSADYRQDHNIRALEESDVIVYPIRYETRAETEQIARRQMEEGSRIDLGSILGGGDPNGPPRGTTPSTFPGEESSRPGIGGVPFPTVIIRRPQTTTRDPRDPRDTTSRDPMGRDTRSPYPQPGDDTSLPGRTRDDSLDRMLDSLYQVADGYLEDLARVSGGRMVRADTLALLPAAFKEIAAELRTQYSIGYYPSTPVNKGGYRKIKIRASRKNAVVRARPGYTAVKPYK